MPEVLVRMAAEAGAEQAQAYALEQNRPNPFSPTTEIRLALPEAGYVRLAVFDILGREVARLVDGPMEAGVHSVTFNAAALPSGMYVYRLKAGEHVATRRLTVAH